MKKILILIASILFSTLFYKQEIGLNLFLFSIISTSLLAIINFEKFKEKTTIIKAFAYVFVSFFVFMYRSDLSIIASILSFFILVGSVSEHKSSTYIKFLNGLFTTIAAAFAKYYETIENHKKKSVSEKQKIDYQYWFKIIGIPLIVITVFVLLYRNINPIFNNLITKIDFSFINITWFLFTGLGYYLFYNIMNPMQINPTTKLDLETGNYLEKNKIKQEPIKKIQNENQLGVVLMILLNILLIFLIITDLIYLNQQSYEVSSAELKSQLHQSVNALITSIVLAMSIIIYFFRGNLNFFKKNKLLKNTTFIWIVLNIGIAIITTYKNYTYITNYGITYKRIGVYIYLFLAITGLIFTFLKVKNINNIWFLFRKNVQVAFVVLILATTVNWDIFITKYNLNNKHESFNYLLSLSNKNAKILKNYADNNSTISQDIKQKILIKFNVLTNDLDNNSWQETVFENYKKQ